jgi:tRNA (cmo5U34)-methyltransferase
MSNNFSSISKFYDALGFLVFGNALKKSQLYFMNKIPPHSKVLVVGGGTGWFLEELVKITSLQKVVYVEASIQMMKLSQQRIAAINPRTELAFINSPIETISLDEKFDVIITNYFLDLFREDQSASIAAHLLLTLNSKGIWMVTDFKVNPKFIHKIWQKALLRIMYLFFRYTSGIEANRLPDLPLIFKQLNLKKIYSEEFFSGMMESAVYKKDWKD